MLRNSRGGIEPSVIDAGRAVLEAGAHGLTVHPRPDQRHVRVDDVLGLAQLTASFASAELNIEGNPFARARGGYPGLVAIARDARPAQCTLVPDAGGQLTSDHGFVLPGDLARLSPHVSRLRECGARVSVFVDAGSVAGFASAAAMGIERIEIYTGPYAHAHATGEPAQALARCMATARAAQRAGLGVNAGHDLAQHNLGLFLREVPGVLEVSIGHALMGEALWHGLAATVRAYLAIVAQGDAEG